MSLILTDRQKIIWAMYHEAGMTPRDISAEMNLDIQYVRVEISVARNKIDESSLNGKFLKQLRLRDVDDVLDEVDKGLRCKGCHLLFTDRSTCTPDHCDAREGARTDHMPGIIMLLQAMANLK